MRDAFGHLKAIAIDDGGQALLQKAGVAPDAGVVAAHDSRAFIAAAKTRQWRREPRSAPSPEARLACDNRSTGQRGSERIDVGR